MGSATYVHDLTLDIPYGALRQPPQLFGTMPMLKHAVCHAGNSAPVSINNKCASLPLACNAVCRYHCIPIPRASCSARHLVQVSWLQVWAHTLVTP